MPSRMNEIRSADRIHDLAVILARAVIRVRRQSACADGPADKSPTSRLELSGPSPLSVARTRRLTGGSEGERA
jgi:hypothetical protein